ncbi:MAG TPA: lasso peptide biosynthesis B2 protein [Candidatus Solibacter sp.]|nr:lasso peptide biosynthesis B2 protein [Candidatus Solibacter sp.]
MQRSIVTVRVMRRRGIPAEVVIGYRPEPFVSHAWVEVAGRVVNDSSTYQRRIAVLERLWADEAE